MSTKSDKPFLDMSVNFLAEVLSWIMLLIFLVVNTYVFGLRFDLVTVLQYLLVVIPIILLYYLTLEVGKRI